MPVRKMPPEKSAEVFLGGVCFITDRLSCPLTCLEMTEVVLRTGVRWVQYRDKERNRLAYYRTAFMLRELTRSFGASLIVNDYADIAAAVDADGVHLGQDDFPLSEARKLLGHEKIIGISTHSLEEALEAEAGGADYVGFGPVFETTTKNGAGSPKGTRMLEKVGSRVSIPVVAIGGIGIDSLTGVMASGAGAVAVASGVLKGDITRNMEQLLQGFRNSGTGCA